MGETYFTVGQFTKENRKKEPEYRVSVWKYETVCYPHLQRSSAESAKLKSNTFDRSFIPQIWNKVCANHTNLTIMMIFSFKGAFLSKI